MQNITIVMFGIRTIIMCFRDNAVWEKRVCAGLSKIKFQRKHENLSGKIGFR